MAGDAPGEGVSVAEAPRRLAVPPRAVRLRIKHGSLDARPRGNAGREVFVSAGATPRGASGEAHGSVPADTPGDDPREPPEVVGLRDALTEERIARARAEGELT